MAKKIKTFLMTTTNGMAIGLFGTLIIGTIFDLFAKIPGASVIATWSNAIKALMGAGIGLGVALSLKKNGVAAVALMGAGVIGNFAFHWINISEYGMVQWNVSSIGDPLSCYLSVICAYFVLELLTQKKTPVDLILVPFIALATAILYSFLLASWVHFITIGIGKLIEASFGIMPLPMCIVISVLTGMALTAPISSVAICVAINMGGVPLAATSALIGCCTQMLGFAVHTARDNKWGSILAVGLGTSMLQFKNIVRKPSIWLPTIIASALLGPLAMLFPSPAEGYSMPALSVGAGMGTSGLVGPINFLSVLGFDSWLTYVMIASSCIVGPLLLVFLLDLLFRKMGVIEKGDFSLSSDIN